MMQLSHITYNVSVVQVQFVSWKSSKGSYIFKFKTRCSTFKVQEIRFKSVQEADAVPPNHT